MLTLCLRSPQLELDSGFSNALGLRGNAWIKGHGADQRIRLEDGSREGFCRHQGIVFRHDGAGSADSLPQRGGINDYVCGLSWRCNGSHGQETRRHGEEDNQEDREDKKGCETLSAFLKDQGGQGQSGRQNAQAEQKTWKGLETGSGIDERVFNFAAPRATKESARAAFAFECYLRKTGATDQALAHDRQSRQTQNYLGAALLGDDYFTRVSLSLFKTEGFA